LRKKYFVLGILLIVVIAIAIPISYFFAWRVVSDAVFKLGFSTSGSISTEATSVSFSGEFIFENSANIQLTIDLVNITIVVYGDSPYDGNLHYLGTLGIPDAIHIGNMIGESKILPPNGQVEVSATFEVTSEDALDRIHSGNYNIGASFREITVSGMFLFWRVTPQIGLI
jgi:hypothetical protein